MDGSLLDIGIFLLATFAGALIAGVTGFAFGLVVAALWLHILTPVQTATLIIAYGLIVQGYAVIRLRHALDWRRLWPFILGAAFGVPAGVAVLGWADPAHVRAATGVFLIVYSVYALPATRQSDFREFVFFGLCLRVLPDGLDQSAFADGLRDMRRAAGLDGL